MRLNDVSLVDVELVESSIRRYDKSPGDSGPHHSSHHV